MRSGGDADREQFRERLFHHDGLAGRARPGGTGAAHDHSVPSRQRPVLPAKSCRCRGGDALLALRRRGVDLPVRHPVSGGHTVPMRRLAVGLLAVAFLAACGGGGGGSAQPAGSIKVTMTEFAFSPSTLSVPSGKVVFYLVNAGTVAHDMVIKDSSGAIAGRSELVSASASLVFPVSNLAGGNDTFIRSQPGPHT